MGIEDNERDSRAVDRLFVDETGRLVLSTEGLGLGSEKPFRIDWASGASHYRAQRWQHEMVIRAVLGKQRKTERVIDCTAGLGRDALILASQGLEVTLLERSEVIFRLLEDTMKQTKELPEWQSTLSRMTLVHADAESWLANLCEDSDWRDLADSTALYCDPMFPQRNKSAKVKREMQIFQWLLDSQTVSSSAPGLSADSRRSGGGKGGGEGKEKSSESSAEKLVGEALSVQQRLGLERVVVKRPLKAPFLIRKPAYSLNGKTVRFDIYPHL